MKIKEFVMKNKKYVDMNYENNVQNFVCKVNLLLVIESF